MTKLTLVLALILSSQAFAGEHQHGKSLGAHEHGSIKLEMAVEGKQIEIDIDGPAESFIGFEYAPKTAKEKKAFKDAQDLWKKDLLTKIIMLDAKLGCSLGEVKFEQEMDDDHHEKGKKESGTHSDIEAEAKINCAQDPKGSMVSVALKKHFPHIKKLQIDLVGSETKTINVTKDVEQFKL
ncbi:DUF2796 domain-containing protein [Bacteriovorax stolpii]|uniref:Uncharacterized protein n=1 Tax=Bacteriovorax stolpii TaxID=960 RepID=A0A2K9NT75_BACTC|nr:DUF2796 domain-containing protein [Bacteriovorax stolpii]AUN98698.1 hypothetical protein C0V70_11410 [Bacteriovorax stolpii]QDK41322.1 DUF2796 domain-containing protein [Bacteriovorax stolpii]TDP55793.1 uncharacterized protein DUF2796 [Bacteriovorax stolpii]